MIQNSGDKQVSDTFGYRASQLQVFYTAAQMRMDEEREIKLCDDTISRCMCVFLDISPTLFRPDKSIFSSFCLPTNTNCTNC